LLLPRGWLIDGNLKPVIPFKLDVSAGKQHAQHRARLAQQVTDFVPTEIHGNLWTRTPVNTGLHFVSARLNDQTQLVVFGNGSRESAINADLVAPQTVPPKAASSVQDDLGPASCLIATHSRTKVFERPHSLAFERSESRPQRRNAVPEGAGPCQEGGAGFLCVMVETAPSGRARASDVAGVNADWGEQLSAVALTPARRWR
jgi:hypothetical protein